MKRLTSVVLAILLTASVVYGQTAARVTVQSTATLIIRASSAQTVALKNPGTTDVYVGGTSTVTTATGFKIAQNETISVSLAPNQTLYGIVTSGTQEIQTFRAPGNVIARSGGGGDGSSGEVTAATVAGIPFSAYIVPPDATQYTTTTTGDPGNVPNGTYCYKFTFSTAEGETDTAGVTGSVVVTDHTTDGQVLVDVPLVYNAAQLSRLNVYRSTTGCVAPFRQVNTAMDLASPFGSATFTDNASNATWLAGALVPSTNTSVGVRYTLIGESLVPTQSIWWANAYYTGWGNPATNDDTGILVHDSIGEGNDAPTFLLKGGGTDTGTGGQVIITGGSAVLPGGGGGGGALLLSGGTGQGAGGNLTITGGTGRVGNGGDITITGGEADPDYVSGAHHTGGDVSINGGSGVDGASNGGAVTITAGSGVPNAGDVTIAAGQANGGGDVRISSGSSSAAVNGNAGSFTIVGGDGVGNGGGGSISITAGNGGNVAGNGGTITLTSGGGFTAGDIQLNSSVASLSIDALKWTTMAFSAGDYTASGSMTWTVAVGDVSRNSYIHIGKTLIWQLGLIATTVGGTPSTELRVAIPTGSTLAQNCFAVAYGTDNGTEMFGNFVGAAGNSYIAFKKVPTANWSASTDNTAFSVTAVCEVN